MPGPAPLILVIAYPQPLNVDFRAFSQKKKKKLHCGFIPLSLPLVTVRISSDLDR